MFKHIAAEQAKTEWSVNQLKTVASSINDGRATFNSTHLTRGRWTTHQPPTTIPWPIIIQHNFRSKTNRSNRSKFRTIYHFRPKTDRGKVVCAKNANLNTVECKIRLRGYIWMYTCIVNYMQAVNVIEVFCPIAYHMLDVPQCSVSNSYISAS